MNTTMNISKSAVTQKPTIGVEDKSPRKEEFMVRVLSVDIRTIRTLLRDVNFNNQNTILEIFRKLLQSRIEHKIAYNIFIHSAKIYRIVNGGRMNRLTLRSVNQDNLYAMEAIYYGNIESFQAGNPLIVEIIQYSNW